MLHGTKAFHHVTRAGVIGHRITGAFPKKPFLASSLRTGNEEQHPENSAHELDVQYARQFVSCVEFDVEITEDGKLVVYHDNDTQRVTGKNLVVAKTDLASLQRLNLGFWCAQGYQDRHIPSFVEMLQACDRHGLAMNVEVKVNDPARLKQHVALVLAELQQYWPKDNPPPLLSSFSIEALQHAKQSGNPYPLGLLLETWRDDWLNVADDIDCVSVHLCRTLVTAERIQAIRKSKRDVLCYTVDDLADAEALMQMGVMTVFTDRLTDLQQLQRKYDGNSPQAKL